MKKEKMRFIPKHIYHKLKRSDKFDKTRVGGEVFIGDKFIGDNNETLTEEEMKVIDDVIVGASRRKSLKLNQ